MRWEHHSEGFLSMLSTFSIILNELSAYLEHNSAKSTIGIFVNLLMPGMLVFQPVDHSA